MKKVLISFLFLSSLCLTACSASSAGVIFDTDFKTFHFDGKDYAITNSRIEESDIRQTKAKFMEFPTVKEDEDGKETISLTNLYETQDKELAIGVQDQFYKVEEEKQVSPTNQIDFQQVAEETEQTSWQESEE